MTRSAVARTGHVNNRRQRAGDQNQNRARDWRGILLVLAICLILRVAIVLASGERTLAGDELPNSALARNVLAGFGYEMGGHPTGLRDPLYPMLLAGTYAAFGEKTVPIGLLQALIDTASCYMLFLLASRYAPWRKTGLVAAAMFAVYPLSVMQVDKLLTETLAAFLAISLVYCLAGALARKPTAWILPGAICGLGILNKGSLLLMPLGIAAVVILGRKRIGQWPVKASLFALVAYAVVAPWTIRNYIALGGFAPTNTYGWSSIWAGTGIADGKVLNWFADPVLIQGTPEAEAGAGTHWVAVTRQTYEKIRLQRDPTTGMSEVAREARLRELAVRQIVEHPGTFAFLGLKKFARLWFNLWYDKAPSKSSLLIGATDLLLLLLAVFGYRRWRSYPEIKRLMLTYAVVTTLVSVVSLSVVRQSVPAWPLVLLFAATPIAARCKEAAGTSPEPLGG